MKGSLRESFQDQNLIQAILSLKDGFIESVRNRNFKKLLLKQKQSMQYKIHLKSHKMRDTSLRQAIKESFKNSIKDTRLSSKIARRNVSRSKYRSLLIVLGILLTIALETGIVISVDTLYDDFIFDNRNQNFTDISVIPQEWSDISNLTDLAKSVKSVAGVSKASPVYSILVNGGLYGPIPDTNILIYGIDTKNHPDFRTLNITAGEKRVSENTVIVSRSLLSQSGYNVGDTINTEETILEVEPRILRVGGVMSDSSFFGNNIGYQFVLIDIETLYEITPDVQKSEFLRPKIDVSVNNILDIKKISEKIKDKLGIEYFVWVEKKISEIEATGIRAYQTAMNLIILASFVVEFLFITNVLAIAIRDRSKEFGILRAVGCNSSQLIKAITIEILIYSVIGGICGLILGIGFAFILVWLMQTFYPTLMFQSLSLKINSLIATFASGIIVALISGLYPIFLALSMPVIQNIHSRMRTRKYSSEYFSYWKYTISMGVLLAITGFSLQFFIGPSRFLDFEILSMHFIIILLIFIGTLLVEVGILFFLPKIAGKFLFLFGIITRTISTRNIAREFQKSLFTIMTSALALTFIIVVGLVSAAVIAGVPIYFENQWGSIELVIEAQDSQLLPTDFTNELESNYQIAYSSFIQETRTEIESVDSYVYGVDPLRYSYFEEDVIDSILDFPSSFFINQTEGNHSTYGTYALVSDLLFERLRQPLGSDISLKIAENKSVNVTVASIINSNIFLGNGEYLYIGTIRYQEFFNSSLAKWFICDVNGEVGAVQFFIQSHFPQLKDVIGVDFYKRAIERSLEFQSAIFQILFIESFCLAAISQFICILVSTYRMEREMGVMRSIGLHKRGVFGIFMAESMALGFSALFIGVIDGLLGSILLIWYISRSIPINITFPLERIILWVLASFLVTLASTYVPSFRSSQKNIVATISGRPMQRHYAPIPMYGIYQAFYPAYNQHAASLPYLHVDRSRSTNVKEERFPTITLWQFIKDNKLQIQTVFLVLMVLITFNYIFDGYILIRGLLPSDLIWRISVTLLINLDSSRFINFNHFIIINPLLFFTGLAVIGPVSYYLIHKTSPDYPIHEIGRSLFRGIGGVIFNLLTVLLYLISIGFVLLLLGPFAARPDLVIFITALVSILFILGILIEFLFVQRVWAYLILCGLTPGWPFRQRIAWIMKTGSKGQDKFIVVLLLHLLIQTILFILSQQIPTDTYTYPELSSISSESTLVAIDPIVFLVLSTIEVGFFLLLTIFQLVQFKNQSHLIMSKNPEMTHIPDLDVKLNDSNVKSVINSENEQ
ncbi:MAG: ABC transporter permease [Candidatus Hodarchaeota archaeon]